MLVRATGIEPAHIWGFSPARIPILRHAREFGAHGSNSNHLSRALTGGAPSRPRTWALAVSGGIRTRTVFLLPQSPFAFWAADAKIVLPASLELASPPYQSGDLPHDERSIGARSIELNVHLSRYKPEALPVGYAGMVLAAGVEPATSRLQALARPLCTPAIRIPPRRKPAPVSALPTEGGALCRGTLSLKLSHSRKGSHARTPSGANGSHARTPLRARACAGLQIEIVDWRCCGPFGPSACYGGGVVARRRLVRFS